MMWLLIEKAYGEYNIIKFASKKEAMSFCPYDKSKKLKAGVYELDTEHSINIVCKIEFAKNMGYKI